MSDAVAGRVQVRGGASAEEIAAVVAVLGSAGLGGASGRHAGRTTVTDGYARWRATRLAALRAGADTTLRLG